jgi:hypothetical protein
MPRVQILAGLAKYNLRVNGSEAYFVDGAVGASASHAAVHSTVYAVAAGAADAGDQLAGGGKGRLNVGFVDLGDPFSLSRASPVAPSTATPCLAWRGGRPVALRVPYLLWLLPPRLPVRVPVRRCDPRRATDDVFAQPRRRAVVVHDGSVVGAGKAWDGRIVPACRRCLRGESSLRTKQLLMLASAASVCLALVPVTVRACVQALYRLGLSYGPAADVGLAVLTSPTYPSWLDMITLVRRFVVAQARLLSQVCSHARTRTHT